MAYKKKKDPRGSNSPMISPANTLASTEENGANIKALEAIIAVQNIARNADRKNVDSLYECFNAYLEYCLRTNSHVTNTLAYGACGLSKYDIDGMADGRICKRDPRYMEFAKYVRSVCSQYREALMASGKMNPVLGIWWQKAYDRYTEADPRELQQEKRKELEEVVDASVIAQKYKNIAKD